MNIIKYKRIIKVIINFIIYPILVGLVVNFFIDYKTYNAREKSLLFENTYNQSMFNTLVETVNNKKLLSSNFSIDRYKDNWDIILEMNNDCMDAQVQAIEKMAAINRLQDSLLRIEDQKSLIFNENQIKNTELRTNAIYEDIKREGLSLYQDFQKLRDCKKIIILP